MAEKEHTHIFHQLAQINTLLHRFQAHHFRNFGPSANPHRGQGRVLGILKMQPEITQKELGYLLDMRNQSLGELLAKLEKSGYITRTPSEKDRRVMNIKLTETGRQATESMEEGQPGMNKALDCFSGEEIDILSGYLNRIIAKLSAELEEIEDGMKGHWHDGHLREHHNQAHREWRHNRGRDFGGFPNH